MNSIDQLWDALLSCDPDLIQEAYKHLGKIEQAAVIDHLIIMSTENGWHLAQKGSAQFALDFINGLEKRKK